VGALRVSSWHVPFVSRLVERAGAGCVQVPVKQWVIPVVDARFIARAHELDLQVHIWTIDDAAEMDRLLDLGVDGIMTDRPSVLKDVLVRRGQWTSSLR
jgi:glycerophosphoryl diester phosphodiesterase